MGDTVSVPAARSAAGVRLWSQSRGVPRGLNPLAGEAFEASEKGRQGAKRASEVGKRSFLPSRHHGGWVTRERTRTQRGRPILIRE